MLLLLLRLFFDLLLSLSPLIRLLVLVTSLDLPLSGLLTELCVLFSLPFALLVTGMTLLQLDALLLS